MKKKDMLLRVGISRQQYQRLESRGNPRLDTLELIAKGLKSELLLIPQEKLGAVKAILENDEFSALTLVNKTPGLDKENILSNDPWKGLLEDNE